MLDSTIATEIISKLAPLTSKIRIIDVSGEVLAQSSLKLGEKACSSKKTVSLNYKGEKLGLIEIYGKTKEIGKNILFAKEISESIIHQKFLLEKIENEEERKDKFVYDLLNNPTVDEDYYTEKAKVLGIEISPLKTLVLIKISDDTPFNKSDTEGKFQITKVKKSIARILNSFYTKSKDNYVAYIGENNFVIIKDLRTNDKGEIFFDLFKKTLGHFYNLLKSDLKVNMTLGVGNFYPQIFGLRESYKEAKLAIKIGSYFGESGVFKISDMGILVPLFLGLKKETLTYSKKAMAKFKNFDLHLPTLETFFDSNMNLTITSKKLKIHRNTLVYRLNRISQKLELDPRNFDDAYKIMLLIFYDRISKEVII